MSGFGIKGSLGLPALLSLAGQATAAGSSAGYAMPVGLTSHAASIGASRVMPGSEGFLLSHRGAGSVTETGGMQASMLAGQVRRFGGGIATMAPRKPVTAAQTGMPKSRGPKKHPKKAKATNAVATESANQIDIKRDYDSYIIAVARSISDFAGRATSNSSETLTAQPFDGVMDEALAQYRDFRSKSALPMQGAIDALFQMRETRRSLTQGSMTNLGAAFARNFANLQSENSIKMQLSILVFFIEAHLARLSFDGIEIPEQAKSEFPEYVNYIPKGSDLSREAFEKMVDEDLPPASPRGRKTLLATRNKTEIMAAIQRGENVHVFGDAETVSGHMRDYGAKGRGKGKQVRPFKEGKAVAFDTIRASYYADGANIEEGVFTLRNGGMIIIQRITHDPYTRQQLQKMYPDYEVLHLSYGLPIYDSSEFDGIRFAAVEVYVIRDKAEARKEEAAEPEAAPPESEVVSETPSKVAEPLAAPAEREVVVEAPPIEADPVVASPDPKISPLAALLGRIEGGSLDFDGIEEIAGERGVEVVMDEVSIEGDDPETTILEGDDDATVAAKNMLAGITDLFNNASLRYGVMQLEPSTEKLDVAKAMIAKSIGLYDEMVTFSHVMFLKGDILKLRAFGIALEGAALGIARGGNVAAHYDTLRSMLDEAIKTTIFFSMETGFSDIRDLLASHLDEG